MAPPHRLPGPLTIKFNADTLGTTKTGAVIRSTSHWEPITDDEHGLAPADWIYAGETIQVDIVALDVANLDLRAVFRQINSGASDLFKGNIANIGESAYANAQRFDIVERDGTSIWTALKVIIVDPSELVLRATQEVQFPLSILVIPDDNGFLFSTLPSYITT